MSRFSPEQRLCLAVLARAIRDYQNDGRDSYSAQRDQAKRWIKSDDNSQFMTFLNMCDILGFNPAIVRKRIFGNFIDFPSCYIDRKERETNEL